MLQKVTGEKHVNLCKLYNIEPCERYRIFFPPFCYLFLRAGHEKNELQTTQNILKLRLQTSVSNFWPLGTSVTGLQISIF
jgi:hypothetical protein